MSDVVTLVPRAREPDRRTQVNTLTVDILRGLLAKAEAGEVVNLVAITWHRNEPPHSHISTEDKILALGAIRTMEHVLVRDWLDGRVTT